MVMDMKITVCIPTWEQHGYGRRYLKEMFDTILQRAKNDPDCFDDPSSWKNLIVTSGAVVVIVVTLSDVLPPLL